MMLSSNIECGLSSSPFSFSLSVHFNAMEEEDLARCERHAIYNDTTTGMYSYACAVNNHLLKCFKHITLYGYYFFCFGLNKKKNCEASEANRNQANDEFASWTLLLKVKSTAALIILMHRV